MFKSLCLEGARCGIHMMINAFGAGIVVFWLYVLIEEMLQPDEPEPVVPQLQLG